MKKPTLHMMKNNLIAIIAVVFLCAFYSNAFCGDYLVDDFEDGNTYTNAHGYWHRYDPGLVDQVADPVTPANNVLRIRMAAGWYATNTWNGSSTATLLDATECTHLSIKVKGESGGEDFKVELQDYVGHKQSYFISGFIGGPVTSDWQEVNIALAPYTTINFEQTTAVAFIFTSAGTIYVDDIRFTSAEPEPMEPFGGTEISLLDDYEDADLSHNAQGYWHRYEPGLIYPTTDPLDAANTVLRVDMSAGWYASNTWDGSDPATLLNARYYTHLAFMVMGASGGEDFGVELQDNDGGIVELPIGYTITDSWQDVAIPLHEFTGINFENVTAVSLKFQTSGRIYIDNVRFAGVVIDDFEDPRLNYNRLNKWVGWGGHSISCVDTPDGAHMITWSHIPVFDVNYWYTVIEFNEPDACCESKYFNQVYFKIKGASGGEDVTVKYEDATDAAYVTLSDYVSVTTEWQEVMIPIKDFTDQGVNREGLKALAFVFYQDGSHTIYVDDIELRYVVDDPYLTDKTTFYKDMPRGIHIGFDPSGDPLIYQATGLPAGAVFDAETGYMTWKPDTVGTYPVIFSVQEDRRDRPVVEGGVDLIVEDYVDPKPESVGPIRVDKATRQLYVDGELFKIKGVGYQPVPIGQDVNPIDPTNTWFENPDIFERDFSLLEQIGVNTIRLWGWPYDEDAGLLDPIFLRDIDPILNAAANHNIKVCLGFWIDDERDVRQGTIDRANIKRNFSLFVNRLKDYNDYPAVLMWVIGNENNYQVFHNRPDWYSLVNELAEIAYDIETDHNGENSYRPVAVNNGDLYNIMDADMNADDASLAYLDIWGSNIYPGYSFVDKLNEFAELSNKPLWVAEYGIDAYHTISYEWDDGGRFFYATDGYVDEAAQADWVGNNTIEIQASPVTCGSTVMAYSDEWWKSRGDTTVHETNGFPWPPDDGVTRQPDDFSNEQYWGIMRLVKHPTPGEIDILFPRQVYYRLEEIFAGDSRVVPGESIQAVIDDPGSTPIILVPEGVYAQDSIINVKDSKTLLGEGDVTNIIIKGRILFAESDGEINNLSIVYPLSEDIIFTNDSYRAGITIGNDAGVTLINSNAVVENCIIQPDLAAINSGGGFEPPLTQYGKGINVWNLYNTPNITLDINNNLILDADTGIFLFAQAFAGTMEGFIEYTTFENNRFGIILRMHKENPYIQHNIITNAEDGIHITYEDDAFLDLRLQNITDNDLWNNTHNVWCDALQSEQVTLPDEVGNISVDPLYDGSYEATEPQCDDKGWRVP